MSNRYLLYIILILSISLSPSANLLALSKPAYKWITLNDAISYTKYTFNNSEGNETTIHGFLIDPLKVKIDIVTPNSSENQGLTAKSLAKKSNAVIVINGGFFTELHKSIGLIISEGKKVNPMHKTSWWSIFGIRNKTPFIEVPKDFAGTQGIEMAIQAGPRLVINGEIPKLKDGRAQRSAVGITRDNKIILAITEGMPISLKDLAVRLDSNIYEGGLDCINAMALDGGSSSQLYSKIEGFELSIDGLSYITNGLAVFLK